MRPANCVFTSDGAPFLFLQENHSSLNFSGKSKTFFRSLASRIEDFRQDEFFVGFDFRWKQSEEGNEQEKIKW